VRLLDLGHLVLELGDLLVLQRKFGHSFSADFNLFHFVFAESNTHEHMCEVAVGGSKLERARCEVVVPWK
jgi:hypothetical protein